MRVMPRIALIFIVMLGTSPSLSAPKRIVSASLASDEIVWDLLSGESRSRILALSHFADDQAYSHLPATQLRGMKLFGGQVEDLVKLKPDLLILASFNRPAVLEYASKSKIPYILLKDFKSLDDIRKNIQAVSKAISVDPKKLTLDLDDLRSVAKEKRPSVLSLAMGFSTMGSDTLFHDLVERAGGVNKAQVYGVKNWAKLSLSRIFTDPPDIIVITDEQLPDWLKSSALNSLKNPSLAQRLCHVESRSLLSTSHHIAKAYHRLVSCIQGWRYRKQK